MEHNANDHGMAGSGQRSAVRADPGRLLAGGLRTLGNVAPGVEPSADLGDSYFAEVSRARNGALRSSGYDFGVPRCECNRGVRDRAHREHLFGDAPIRFTPSDRSMVFHRFETHYLVKAKPSQFNWSVLLGTDYLRTARGRERRFKSEVNAMRAALKAERVSA